MSGREEEIPTSNSPAKPSLAPEQGSLAPAGLGGPFLPFFEWNSPEPCPGIPWHCACLGLEHLEGGWCFWDLAARAPGALDSALERGWAPRNQQIACWAGGPWVLALMEQRTQVSECLGREDQEHCQEKTGRSQRTLGDSALDTVGSQLRWERGLLLGDCRGQHTPWPTLGCPPALPQYSGPSTPCSSLGGLAHCQLQPHRTNQKHRRKCPGPGEHTGRSLPGLTTRGGTLTTPSLQTAASIYILGASLVAQTVKNLSKCRRLGSTPGWGRSPGGGHGNSLQYSCLENPMDRGAQQATVHGVAQLAMTEVT